MLPPLLCEELCSLNPQVDRLTYSCVWRMNGDGTLVDGEPAWFGRSVIRSCCKLDYTTAQNMIEGAILPGSASSTAPELWDPNRQEEPLTHAPMACNATGITEAQMSIAFSARLVMLNVRCDVMFRFAPRLPGGRQSSSAGTSARTFCSCTPLRRRGEQSDTRAGPFRSTLPSSRSNSTKTGTQRISGPTRYETPTDLLR